MSRTGTMVFALALAAGCRDPAPPVRIGQLLIDGALGGDGVELRRPLVREALQRALEQSRRLKFDAQQGEAILRARAVAGRAPPDATGWPVVVLQLALEERPRIGKPSAIETEAEVRGRSAIDRVDDLVVQAAQAAVAKVERLLVLGERPTGELLATLQGDDRELRLHALSLLAERRDPAAYQALVGALEDDDAQIALRAVGGLVALGDPRAVGALTDLTHRKSPALVRQIVYAVGAIGGREAEAYLFTVASGHPDPEVQRAAREMLKERGGAGASSIAAPQEESP
ncbi:MAG: HEAT repeat domain-containing protein [Deltaproteobacteria bacterium]|nr:HEAT repeat domain-containing protein [Deltaproteobacteria bacterium]